MKQINNLFLKRILFVYFFCLKVFSNNSEIEEENTNKELSTVKGIDKFFYKVGKFYERTITGVDSLKNTIETDIKGGKVFFKKNIRKGKVFVKPLIKTGKVLVGDEVAGFIEENIKKGKNLFQEGCEIVKNNKKKLIGSAALLAISSTCFKLWKKLKKIKKKKVEQGMEVNIQNKNKKENKNKKNFIKKKEVVYGCFIFGSIFLGLFIFL